MHHRHLGNTLLLLGCLLLLGMAWQVSSQAAPYREVLCRQGDQAPPVNGREDPVWEAYPEYVVLDRVSGQKIFLKTMYVDDTIYFLVRYSDPDKNDQHKPWVWNQDMEAYVPGKQREDTFVFKFAMDQATTDLSSFADEEYIADVWYWKAARTNGVGYADDKLHILSTQPGKKAQKVTSKSGKTMYLMRLGDKGRSAYTSTVYAEKIQEVMPKYILRQPTGSRADVRAKGEWRDGMWTIVFARKLQTGHEDDVQFVPGKTYKFGVSIHGLYGEPLPQSPEANLYGKGRISEMLLLHLESQVAMTNR